MGQLPTVTIKDPRQPGGFLIINQMDFDPAKHEMFDAAPQPVVEALPIISAIQPTETEQATDDRPTRKRGGK